MQQNAAEVNEYRWISLLHDSFCEHLEWLGRVVESPELTKIPVCLLCSLNGGQYVLFPKSEPSGMA